MEEDIRKLKEIIELCEEEINNNDENVTAILDLEDLKSLRNLIKAYKELEEENKTLNERNQYLVKYRAKLEKELYESNENYIPVFLVEEKIEERKLWLSSNDIGYKDDYVLEVLQELLESEDIDGRVHLKSKYQLFDFPCQYKQDVNNPYNLPQSVFKEEDLGLNQFIGRYKQYYVFYSILDSKTCAISIKDYKGKIIVSQTLSMDFLGDILTSSYGGNPEEHKKQVIHIRA